MRKVASVRRMSALAAAIGLLVAAVPTARAAASTIGTQEWWLYGSLNYSGAWPTSLGDGVTVAVIGDVADTGVNDLSGSFVDAETFPPNLPVTDPDLAGQDCESTEAASLIAGHGHPVAGGTDGVVGLAAHAKVMPLGITVRGTQLTSSTYFAEAVQTAVQGGAKVVDVVVPTANDATVRAAIDAAVRAGVVVVAPAGENGTTGNVVWTPAVYPGVLAVGAAQPNGTEWSSSAHGPKVSVAAPGVGVIAEGPAGRYVKHTGTVCASALVAGEAALLWKVHPTWTAGQIEQVVLDTASGRGKRVGAFLGYGVVNPTAAVAALAPAADSNPLLPASPGPHPTASARVTDSAQAAPAGGTTSATSSNNLIFLIVGIVVALAAIGGLILWWRGRKPRRYAIPPPAAPINLGPSDYAAYQQQQGGYYPPDPDAGSVPGAGAGTGTPGYPGEEYQGQGQVPGQAYPQSAGLDESGYSLSSFGEPLPPQEQSPEQPPDDQSPYYPPRQ